jgi:hypothetical protein
MPDQIPNPDPQPDTGEATPPHGDELIGEERNTTGHAAPHADDANPDPPGR